MHGLHYVDDPTNFQPLLTPRNLVRHYLSGQSIDDKVGHWTLLSQTTIHLSM